MKNKLDNVDKQPRYSMRKLSVGLVSCIVGYGVFGIPVFAEKIDNFQ